LPFEGTIDWNWLIGKLKECNYNGPITLEVGYEHNCINISPIEFYKKVLELAKEIAQKFED
jgi:sugar phosphate isomerase/epimerase